MVGDAIVVVNREQGGQANITNNNIQMHSLFTLSDLLFRLQKAGKIDASTVDTVENYIGVNQIKAKGTKILLECRSNKHNIFL